MRFLVDAHLPATLCGTLIYDGNDNQIGGITSSTVSPILSNVAICLGFVKKMFAEIGTVLVIPAEGEMRKGSVATLPFVR